jgi:hypothetical protein
VRRQIPTGVSGKCQTRYGQAKPQEDGAIPDRAAAPRALNPTEGGAETGGGPANRNYTISHDKLFQGTSSYLLV